MPDPLLAIQAEAVRDKRKTRPRVSTFCLQPRMAFALDWYPFLASESNGSPFLQDIAKYHQYIKGWKSSVVHVGHIMIIFSKTINAESLADQLCF